MRRPARPDHSRKWKRPPAKEAASPTAHGWGSYRGSSPRRRSGREAARPCFEEPSASEDPEDGDYWRAPLPEKRAETKRALIIVAAEVLAAATGAPGGSRLLLRRLGDERLGGEHEARDRRGVLQRR